MSAPCGEADATFVVGVNHETFDVNEHKVVSRPSCTTNCFVPMIKVLDDAFGVRRSLTTTRLHRLTRAWWTARTTTCAVPAPPPSTSCRRRPAPPGPPAWCSSR
ncbi:MAG: hypothetical protein R2690_21285 [Acidimicrobiales bacterium]